MFEDEPNYIVSSSKDRSGKEDLLDFIGTHLDTFKRAE